MGLPAILVAGFRDYPRVFGKYGLRILICVSFISTFPHSSVIKCGLIRIARLLEVRKKTDQPCWNDEMRSAWKRRGSYLPRTMKADGKCSFYRRTASCSVGNIRLQVSVWRNAPPWEAAHRLLAKQHRRTESSDDALPTFLGYLRVWDEKAQSVSN
jgi:hypothetical protein